MATFCSCFVVLKTRLRHDANAAQICEIETRQRSLDVVDDDAPKPCVVFADEAGDGSDRHVRDERHGQRLEQQREARSGSGPGHVDLFDAAIRARDARRARMQERLVLEEIEMPPLLHRGVVHGTIGLGAVRAREAPASEEVDLDVEPLARGVERARLDLPSWRSRALHGRGTSPRAS